ncbi:MAG: hypothetical protein WDN10_01865 [bacterium]
MQAVLSDTQARRLRKAGDVLTRTSTKKLRDQVAAQEKLLRQRQERERQERLRTERERREYEIRWQARRAKARTGLANLLELAQSPDMQRLIALNKEPGACGSFTFYGASRPSGDDWPNIPDDRFERRDVRVVFFATGIDIDFGARYNGDMSCISIYFNEVPSKGAEPAFLVAWDERTPYRTYDSFLDAFIRDTGDDDAVLALKVSQRKHAWFPDLIAGQVVVDCADKRKLGYFLKRALATI